MQTLPYRALALDLGTNCGYAQLEGRRIVSSGVATFRLPASMDMRDGHRLLAFYNWLRSNGRQDDIFYEHINKFAGANIGAKGGKFRQTEKSVRLYYALWGTLEFYCAGAGIRLFNIHNTTLKKQFTGNHIAKKHEMCRRAHELGWRGGYPGTDVANDEADAVAMLFTTMWQRGEEISF